MVKARPCENGGGLFCLVIRDPVPIAGGMSLLTDFAATQFQRARTIIGGESLAIGGGTAVSAVLAEVSNGREYDDGFDRSQTLDAVVAIADWDAAYTAAAATYLGKTATARGLTFRVAAIRKGQGFVTVSLKENSKGA